MRWWICDMCLFHLSSLVYPRPGWKKKILHETLNSADASLLSLLETQDMTMRLDPKQNLRRADIKCSNTLYWDSSDLVTGLDINLGNGFFLKAQEDRNHIALTSFRNICDLRIPSVDYVYESSCSIHELGSGFLASAYGYDLFLLEFSSFRVDLM